MTPRIFDIDEQKRLTLIPESLMIEEIKLLVDKYKDKCIPYLAFCHLMSSIDSPLRSLPEEEKRETAVIEIHLTVGEFDETDPLLDRCINKLKSLYTTPILRLFEGLSEEVDNILYYLKTTPTSDDNVSFRSSLIEKAGKLAISLATAKKQVEEEQKAKTVGNRETGTIR